MLRNLRRLLVSAPCASRADLSGKQVIVTGASPGSIGFETARTLLTWGASVVVTSRSNSHAVADAVLACVPPTGTPGRIDAHPLDLARADSVARFADWYAATHGERLDVLVNNAGIHLDLRSQWKTPRLTEDGREIHWRTNYLGTAHLTQLLLPLLVRTGRQSGDARVVNVVSQLYTRGSNDGLFQPPQTYNSWVAYGLSKLALVHATFELQRRQAGSGVHAYCLHPGAVFTHIADRGLEGSRWIAAVRKVLAPVEAFFLLTPEEGAQTQIHCATRPGLAGGGYFRRCGPVPTNADAQDAQVSARLWDETQAWVQSLRRPPAT